MAEVTGLRNNALPYPIYGVPFGVTFPMLDADGDLVTGATTPDAERSLNGDTFADCTNESTEIATNSGVYYLLLTGAEMTADVVTVIAKSATAGMKTTVLTLYPRKLVSLRTGTSQTGAAGTITLDASASAIDDYYNGCVCVAVIDTLTEARVITDYVGSTKVASVTPNWNVTPDSDDTFTIYLTEGRQIPQSDNVGWLGTALPSSDTAGYPKVTIKDGTGTGEIDTTSGGVLVAAIAANAITATSINADAITAGKIADGAIDAATFAAGAINAAAIATDAIGAAELAADAVTEIRSLASGTSDSGSTTTMVDAARTEADNDYWTGCLIVFTSGNIAGQARQITSFVAATDTITFAPAATQAVSTQTYEIWPSADYLRSTTYGRTLDVSAGGEAGLDWANIGSPTTAQNLSATNIDVDQIVASVSGAVGSVTGLTAATVHSDLDDIQARLPAALTANGNIKADTLRVGGTVQTGGDLSAQIDAVDNFVDTEVAAIKTVVDAVQAKTDNLPSDPADASVVAGLIGGLDTKLDTIDNFVDTEITALTTMLTGVVPLNGTIGATGNSSTTLHLAGIAWGDEGPNSMLLLVQDVSGGIYVSRWIEDFATATDLATVATLPFTPEASVDKYWVLSPRADVTGGSGLDAAGVRAAVGLASANLDTQLADIETKVDDTEGLITTVDTVVDAILVDTNELQTDWADGGRLDLILDARASQTSVNTIDDFLDTEIAAILADTNELQVDWVNGGRLDLLIDGIKAKTDNLPSDPADESALEALLDALPTAVENANALLDLASGVETGLTPRQSLRLMAAVLLGKASGLETTTAVYRDIGDSKDRITATVDVDGNRSAVTLDAS